MSGLLLFIRYNYVVLLQVWLLLGLLAALVNGKAVDLSQQQLPQLADTLQAPQPIRSVSLSLSIHYNYLKDLLRENHITLLDN